MKLGNIGRQEALALIAKHNGDRDEITAELFSRESVRNSFPNRGWTTTRRAFVERFGDAAAPNDS